MKRIWPFFIALLFASPLFAQKVNFKTQEIEGETVIFTYDLEGAVPGQTFDIRISIRVNGREQELREVTGDVGKNIREGKDKKIVWHAKRELIEFKGEIKPLIAAEVTFSPINKVEVLGGTSLKRGKTYTLNWVGGVSDQPVNVELLKGNRTVATLKNNVPNNGKTNVTIPKNLKSGTGYRLRVLLVLNPTNKAETEELKISRSFPLGVIIVGGAAITGAAIYLLLFSGDDEPEPGPEEPVPLPDAPTRPRDG
ncbi:Ser-Thr-rich GPI-anchored membrane family protein [Bacteroidota bacterium]